MGWFRLIPRVIQEVRHNSASIYLFKVNNRKTKKMCEICSNLTKQQKKNNRTTLLTAIRYPVTKHEKHQNDFIDCHSLPSHKT